MSVRYTKPFLRVEDQLVLLDLRGMSIDDEVVAARALDTIGYYNLSGYWYPMRRMANQPHPRERLDDFEDGVSFSDVMALYQFDKMLRLLVLEKIEQVEQAVKVAVAQVLGIESATAHTKRGFFRHDFVTCPPGRDKSRHDRWLAKHSETLNDRRSQWNFIEHYLTNYSPPPPIWIAIETWDFGETSRLVSGLNRPYSDNIAERFGVRKSSVFESWLAAIGSVRNICAHHERLWNRDITRQPNQHSDSFFSGAAKTDKTWHRFYGIALILAYLDSTIVGDTTWGARLANHVEQLPVAPGVHLGAMGMPSTWSEHTAWRA